jgi:predicted PurR-regulated permease PerM
MLIPELIAAQPMFVVILEFVVLIGVFLTTVGAGVRWLVKHYFDEIKAELKPNHGSSIKDQITRLENAQEKLEEKMDKQHASLESKVDNLYNKLFDYISSK